MDLNDKLFSLKVKETKEYLKSIKKEDRQKFLKLIIEGLCDTCLVDETLHGKYYCHPMYDI